MVYSYSLFTTSDQNPKPKLSSKYDKSAPEVEMYIVLHESFLHPRTVGLYTSEILAKKAAKDFKEQNYPRYKVCDKKRSKNEPNTLYIKNDIDMPDKISMAKVSFQKTEKVYIVLYESYEYYEVFGVFPTELGSRVAAKKLSQHFHPVSSEKERGCIKNPIMKNNRIIMYIDDFYIKRDGKDELPSKITITEVNL